MSNDTPGFTPADEDLEIPDEAPKKVSDETPQADEAPKKSDETPQADEAPMSETPPADEAPKKANITPDLSDEQYMEQLFLIAQAIAVMPGQRDGMPNVTTPPPIRPRWAAFLLSLGMRIDPARATHRLAANPAGPAAGNWGPRERVEISNPRKTMNRTDLHEVWEQMNPESFAKAKSGEMTAEDLLKMMPAELQQAVAMAKGLREQEQREAQDRAAREARK